MRQIHPGLVFSRHGRLFASPTARPAVGACLVALAMGAPLFWLSPAPAEAQGWLEDRDTATGPGIRVGNLELHPGLGAEVGYDSNVFLTDPDAPDDELVQSALLRVTPHLFISTLGADRLDEGDGDQEVPFVRFQAGLSASLYAFLADDTPNTNVDIGADLDLTLGRGEPLAFRLTNDYLRSIRPFTEQGAEGNNYARDRNDAGATFQFSTPGDVLGIDVGYHFIVDIFEGESFSANNSIAHQARTRTAWKFLPQSALVHDFDFTFTDYTGDTTERVSYLSDSAMFRSRLGFNGAITSRLSFLAMAGYAVAFVSDLSPDGGTTTLDEYQDFVAQVELGYDLAPGAKLSLGYDRNYFPSLVGGWTRRDLGYLEVSGILARVVLLRLRGSFGAWEFGPMVASDGGGLGTDDELDRDDLRARATVYGEYRMLEWLALTAQFGYTGTFTDFEFSRERGMLGVVPDPAEFQKFDAWFGVRAFF
jgi:hypothetical protein